jgi:hypothetical protein
MSLSVEWDDPDKTILCYTIAGAWTWQDMDVLWAKGEHMVADYEQRFDIILNAREMNIFPRDVFEVVSQRYDFRSRNGGVTVVVCASPTVRAVLDMLILKKPRMFSHFRFADTFEDAYRLIAKNRAKTA